MNFKLIETLLIALLPLFAATSAAQVSAAGPMLRNLEEDLTIAFNGRDGKRESCGTEPDIFLVLRVARRAFNFLLDTAGVQKPADGALFLGGEVQALNAVVGSQVWQCIASECGYEGTEIQVDEICLIDGLIAFLEQAERDNLAALVGTFGED